MASEAIDAFETNMKNLLRIRSQNYIASKTEVLALETTCTFGNYKGLAFLSQRDDDHHFEKQGRATPKPKPEHSHSYPVHTAFGRFCLFLYPLIEISLPLELPLPKHCTFYCRLYDLRNDMRQPGTTKTLTVPHMLLREGVVAMLCDCITSHLAMIKKVDIF